MRTAPALLLLLSSCATGAATGSHAEDLAAAFALPAPLAVDPASLKFAPLRFEPPEPRIETLPNGLKVYLLPDRSVPLVQLRALVAVGNLDDPPDKVGLAQIAWSALQLGGAGELSADAVDDTLENMAALVGAEADDESSDLGMEVRSADLDKALPLFVDLLRRPRFEQAALSRLLDQGRDAVARRRDDAGHVAQVAFVKAVWGEASPFAREPTLDSLSRIGREDVVALHRAAVVPGATRLVVTGDFEPGAVLEKLKALAADWAPGPGLARKLPRPPPPRGRQVIVVPTSGAQAKVRLGHLGPARHDPREMALRLVDAVLGGNLGPSRLYTDIRDQRGLAYSVDSAIGTGLVRGLVLLSADTKPETAKEVISRCLEQLEAIRGPVPPTEAEIALAREGFVNAYAFRFDTAGRAAYLRASSDLHGYPPDYFRTFRAALQAVTPEQVAEAAREVLEPAALQIVVVGDPSRLGDLSEFGPVRTEYGEPPPPSD